uniref:Unconventional myosin-XVIIIa n=1 Tax=Macrostomum lignano TaxID=282301 RepID=A0A1I8GQW9_9PLAT
MSDPNAAAYRPSTLPRMRGEFNPPSSAPSETSAQQPKRGILRGAGGGSASPLLDQGVATVSESVTTATSTTAGNPCAPGGDRDDADDDLCDDGQDGVVLVEDKSFSVRLPLADPSPLRPPELRKVTLARTAKGDFGFQLRKTFLYDRASGEKLPVMLAEPGQRANLGLLPGDRLVTINGIDARSRSKEEIVDIIRQSEGEICLTVQQVPELSELSSRARQQQVCKRCLIRQQMKVGADINSAVRVRNAQQASGAGTGSTAGVGCRFWLVHKEGYTGCTVVEKLQDYKVRVRLEHNGKLITVESDDIEQANSAKLDRVENLIQLRYLNECSLVHVLRARYSSNLIHTYCGPGLLVLNPMYPLSIYTERVMETFRGCRQQEMPPHIYASAQMAYRSLLTNQSSQAVCLVGRSGSGKSYCVRHLLHYFLQAGSCPSKVVTVDRLRALSTLTEAFVSSRTIMNTNASRCAQLYAIDFDYSGCVSGLSYHVLLLERSRIVRRPEGEPAFHVFYYMLSGLSQQERERLLLNNPPEPNQFLTPLHRPEDQAAGRDKWLRIVEAGRTLGVSEQEWHSLCKLLAAIFHLGTAGAVQLPHGGFQFEKVTAAERAASLLGCSAAELRKFAFQLGQSDSKAAGGQAYSPFELLQGFVTGLYTEVVTLIMFLVNRCFSCGERSSRTITVLDPPGFQQVASCGRTTGASFEDLCYNYAQERLLGLNYELNLALPRERHEEEDVDISNWEVGDTNPADLISLMDRQSGAALAASNSAVKSGGDSGPDQQQGLLWLLDEESVSGNDQSFVRRMHQLYHRHKQQFRDRNSRLLRRAKGGNFVLNHCNLTTPVLYNPLSWLKNCREYPSSGQALELLERSADDFTARLISEARAQNAGVRRGPLRPNTSMLYRQKSVSAQVKSQMDYLTDLMKKASSGGRIHFVYCLSPVHNAGLCDLKSSLMAPDFTQGVNTPLLRLQLRAFHILNTVRSYKYSYPEQANFRELRQRYASLAKPEVRQAVAVMLDEREAATAVLEDLGLAAAAYKIGNTQVFFRSGALAQLDERREEAARSHLVHFQAACRGHLARRRAHEARVRAHAAEIIQRNCAIYMELRRWPWWRLYSRVRPLALASARAAGAADPSEVAELRARIEQLERERAELRQRCAQLENKLTNANNDLRHDRSEAANFSEQLETERERRLIAEREADELRQKLSAERRRYEQLENELTVLHQKDVQSALRSSRLEDSSSKKRDDTATSDDGEETEVMYRLRIDRLGRDLATANAKLADQEAEHYDQRKAVEARLQTVSVERDDLVEEVAGLKRRATKTQQEASDLRAQLEEALDRKSDLEKRQKRHDAELARLNQELSDQLESREALQRTRDELLGDKWRLERELQDAKASAASAQERSQRLQDQLADLTGGLMTSAGSASESEFEMGRLKRARADLEQKVASLEEEMAREAEERDAELDNQRYAQQRRLRNLEEQLEEEQQERQRLAREKREAERQLAELVARDQDGASASGGPRADAERRRQRKELKRLRAVLKDTQAELEQVRRAGDQSGLIKQLREQLEDAESARDLALRGRRSAEADLEELQLDDKLAAATRTSRELAAHNEELEDELNDLLRKCKAAASRQEADQRTVQSQAKEIEALLSERDQLKQRAAELDARLASAESDTVDRAVVAKYESRIRELESKLDLETTAKTRLTNQVDRLKEQSERTLEERDTLQSSEQAEKEKSRRLTKQLRDLKDDATDLEERLADSERKRNDLAQRFETAEEEKSAIESELKAAKKRIADLQAMLQDGQDSEDDDLLSDVSSGDPDERVEQLIRQSGALLKTRPGSFDSNSQVSDRK